LGDYQNALTSFQRFLTLVTSLEDRSAANFWIGKTQNAMGEVETAQATWETTAGIDPTGYYSERARDILHNRPPFAPPLGYDLMFDESAERARAEAWLRSNFGLPADTDLSAPGLLANEPNLQRGAELWELGLHNMARAEFEQLRRTVAPDAANSYRLMNYLVDLGAYRSAILAARQVLDLALMDDATTLNAPVYFNHLRFGAYYNDLVTPLAVESGFHPLFLFSTIRQESLFDSYVSSSADARGLMQIIPATGADIAKNLGWPEGYISEDLFHPQVNIRFGIDYLDTQRNAFDGNMYAALAAYNGGPGNARGWYNMAPEDPDVLLEIIRFIETRNYIRSIYEIFNIYRLIYDRTP
jgi:soluble lytic murein transglycosylase